MSCNVDAFRVSDTRARKETNHAHASHEAVGAFRGDIRLRRAKLSAVVRHRVHLPPDGEVDGAAVHDQHVRLLLAPLRRELRDLQRRVELAALQW